MSGKTVSFECFAAQEGDCILVSCSDGASTVRILFDGGRAATYKSLRAALEKLPADERELDLLVVTHVDRDHIEGVLPLLKDAECPVTFKDVWFNGFQHLNDEEFFGAVQGEKLTTLLVDGELPWNKAFAGHAVVVPASGDLPVKQLGDVRLTVLSPDPDKLLELHPKWIKECNKAGIIPYAPGEAAEPGEDEDEESFGPIDVEALADTPFDPDDAEANGSSIAVLLEYGKHAFLLTGDAHVDRLVKSLESLGASKNEPLLIRAFKVSHHGSSHNTSRELLELVDCSHFIVSTNGNYFQHPTREAIARIAKFGGASKVVAFNYDTKFTQPWDVQKLQNKYGYSVQFGDDGYYSATFSVD